MIAAPPAGARRRPVITAPRVTAVLLVAFVAFPLLFDAARQLWLIAYLALVLVTCFVLRSSRREPGSWLSRRAVRRTVVVLIAAACAALAASPPPTFRSPSGGYLWILLLLVILNVALGTATGGVAAAPDATVDERQEELRNRAHRIAYVVFAVVVGGTAVVADLWSTQSRQWLGSSVGGGGLFAFLELLFVLPGMVLAFIEPAPARPGFNERADPPGRGRRAHLAAALLTLSLAIPVVMSVAVLALPLQTSAAAHSPIDGVPAQSSGSRLASTCREFQATSVAGLGIEASVLLHAEACWDGRRATEGYGMNASDCVFAPSELVTVTPTRCSRTTSPDGTLSFVYAVDVSPALLPFTHRQVTMQLTVDRNGVVERFP